MLDPFQKPEDGSARSARLRWIALLCYCAILGYLLSRHSFWRDEVQAYEIAVKSDSIFSLFHSLRYEGHPALWYVLLRALNIFFDSPAVMLWAHWGLASLNAFLILWFCPIPIWQRIACCFGYFMLFEYGLVCRNYAMGALLAFTFVVVHNRYKRAVVGPALILALLVHTSIPGAFLAVSLLAFLALECRVSVRRKMAATVVVGVSVATMVLYVTPPADSFFAKYYRERRHQLTVKGAINNARMFLRVAAPIPRPDTVHFWSTNWSDSIAPDYVRKAIQYPAAALCLFLAAISMIHRRNVILLFSVGTVLVGGFPIIHGQTEMRHQGQWFILLLLCYWVDAAGGAPDARLFGGWQRKIRLLFPAIIFAIQPLAVITPIVRSLDAPFSVTPALVRKVLDEHLDHELWSAYPEYFVAPVSAASGDAVYSPQQDRFEYFSLTTDSVGNVTSEVAAHRLAALVDDHHSLILFINDDDVTSIVARLPEHITVRRLAFLPAGIVQDEANVSLLIQKTE